MVKARSTTLLSAVLFLFVMVSWQTVSSQPQDQSPGNASSNAQSGQAEAKGKNKKLLEAMKPARRTSTLRQTHRSTLARIPAKPATRKCSTASSGGRTGRPRPTNTTVLHGRAARLATARAKRTRKQATFQRSSI